MAAQRSPPNVSLAPPAARLSQARWHERFVCALQLAMKPHQHAPCGPASARRLPLPTVCPNRAYLRCLAARAHHRLVARLVLHLHIACLHRLLLGLLGLLGRRFLAGVALGAGLLACRVPSAGETLGGVAAGDGRRRQLAGTAGAVLATAHDRLWSAGICQRPTRAGERPHERPPASPNSQLAA